MYTVKKLPENVQLPLQNDRCFDPKALPEAWNALEEAKIELYPWDTTGYKPECGVRLGWTKAGLEVLMYSMEPVIRAEVTDVGGPCYQDSCLELYIASESRAPYINFEGNANAAMFISIGSSRADRERLSALPEGMQIVTSRHEGGWWAIAYHIPAAFLQEKAGITLTEGAKLTANFYKCGDATAARHYGQWNLVALEKPDFHRPEFFGDLVLA